MILVDTIPADRFEKTKIKGAVNAGLPKEMKDLKPEEKEAFLKTLGDNKGNYEDLPYKYLNQINFQNSYFVRELLLVLQT